MSGFNLNSNKGVLKSLTSASHEELSKALGTPRMPVEIVSIVFGNGVYTAFYRSRATISIGTKPAKK